jgi:glycosyltransferase involved in cell wall biosynthesis
MPADPPSSPSSIPAAVAAPEDAAAAGPLVTVVIPAYEEQRTIEEVLRGVGRLPFRLEVIVVDDGSKDATTAIVDQLAAEGSVPGLRLIRHDANRGKGAAVRTGIAASRGDLVVIQDADAEYDPRDLPGLLAPLVEGRADVVYGTRLRGGQPQRAHLFWHYAGNRFLSLLTNVLYNTTISDMEVGYKAFDGELIRSLTLESDDFGFEPEVTAKILRRGDVRLFEMPISYYGRTYAEGKKITWRDGVKAVAALLRYRVKR